MTEEQLLEEYNKEVFGDTPEEEHKITLEFLIQFHRAFRNHNQLEKMTEQRKLCKDCLYYKKSWLGHLFRNNSLDRCYNPIITGDLVTGDKKSESCKDARHFEMYCGRDGKYFEQLWGDRK